MGTNLAERVQANAIDRQGSGAVTLQQQIRSMEHQFAMAMPRGAEAAQLVRDVLTCLSTTPKLMQANPVTVLGAAMKDALPAATMVVAGLIRPEMKVEIEVTAFRE